MRGQVRAQAWNGAEGAPLPQVAHPAWSGAQAQVGPGEIHLARRVVQVEHGGMVGQPVAALPAGSYVVLTVTFVAGIAATVAQLRYADNVQ